LTRDVVAAPLFIGKTTRADGKAMRHITRILGVVLNAARPFEVRTTGDLQKALDITKEACAKHGLAQTSSALLAFLVKEIARVFVELRAILRRQRTGAARRLFASVQNYICRVKRPILCFSYNSMKLAACLYAANKCGRKSVLDQSSARAVLKNIYLLQKSTRTMAVLPAYHRGALRKALQLAKAA
jgi:hypothetical protein